MAYQRKSTVPHLSIVRYINLEQTLAWYKLYWDVSDPKLIQNQEITVKIKGFCAYPYLFEWQRRKTVAVTDVSEQNGHSHSILKVMENNILKRNSNSKIQGFLHVLLTFFFHAVVKKTTTNRDFLGFGSKWKGRVLPECEERNMKNLGEIHGKGEERELNNIKSKEFKKIAKNVENLWCETPWKAVLK